MTLSKMIVSTLVASAVAQQVGKQMEEMHLKVPIQSCTKAAGCSSEATAAVMDSNWRWTHELKETKLVEEEAVAAITDCYQGNAWSSSLCPDVATCTEKCAIDGIDEKTWSSTYGVHADSKGMLNISFVTNGTYSRNVGARTYLMDADGDKYKMFTLLNKEFSFDVDVSNLPCGVNGALYFVEMDADGGKSKYESNEAGAAYGTGYCDAQCPHDLKWINGEANIIGWNGSKTDPNAGQGKYGTCCAELDIWEANVMSTQMTVHGCTVEGQTRCEGVDCGDNSKGERFQGVCDKDGCDLNPFRMGNTSFFGAGPGFTVDSRKPLTVVTQFLTSDGTADGDLVEMRRLYVQNGKVVGNANAANSYGAQYDSITDKMCTVQKETFGDVNDFAKKGSLKAMGDAMRRGMVLTMSLWDDHEVGMIWLDATDPYPVPAGKKGAKRGTCSQKSGDAATVEKEQPGSHVLYSNIKYGEIGTTFGKGPSPPSPTPTPTPGSCKNKAFDQCGGSQFSGDTCCPDGFKCVATNKYYSQCTNKVTPSSSPPPPSPASSCPGGALSKCIALCPSNPATAYQACVQSCVSRCSAEIADYEAGKTTMFR